MKLEEALSSEYQRKYDKACRDWKAGRNLHEAAGIVCGTTSKRRIASLVKQREAELATQRKQGNTLRVEGLGRLTHKGEDYVGKAYVLLFPKKKVHVIVPSGIADVSSVAEQWKRFRKREKTLLRELQSAVSRHYRSVVVRPAEADHPPMRRIADIWASLGEPELVFQKRRKGVELVVGWTPAWEEEHGVYAFLDSHMAVGKVGDFC